eukprot:UN08668
MICPSSSSSSTTTSSISSITTTHSPQTLHPHPIHNPKLCKFKLHYNTKSNTLFTNGAHDDTVYMYDLETEQLKYSVRIGIDEEYNIIKTRQQQQQQQQNSSSFTSSPSSISSTNTNTTNSNILHSPATYIPYITAMAAFDHGDMLITGNNDGTLRLLDLRISNLHNVVSIAPIHQR